MHARGRERVADEKDGSAASEQSAVTDMKCKGDLTDWCERSSLHAKPVELPVARESLFINPPSVS